MALPSERGEQPAGNCTNNGDECLAAKRYGHGMPGGHAARNLSAPAFAHQLHGFGVKQALPVQKNARILGNLLNSMAKK